MKEWIGSPPENCNICQDELVSSFVDGKTIYGPWAIMCATCHEKVGTGIGTGHGQSYSKMGDGRWRNIG